MDVFIVIFAVLVIALLGVVLLKLSDIQLEQDDMTEAVERLKNEVSETRTAIASAIALIAGLAAAIRESIDDEDELNALADALDEQQNELAAAVTANTPAEPAPTPDQPAPPTDEVETPVGGSTEPNPIDGEESIV